MHVRYDHRDTEQDDGNDGAAQRFGIQPPRARWKRPSKNQRSRARSGRLQCRVGRLRRFDATAHARLREECALELQKMGQFTIHLYTRIGLMYADHKLAEGCSAEGLE